MQPLSFGRKLWVAGFVIGAGILMVNSAFAAVYADRIYPGVKIGSLSVGGLTRMEAQRLLNGKVNQYSLQIQLQDKTIQVNPSRFGGKYDLEETVNHAYLMGRDQLLDVAGLWSSMREGNIRLAYNLQRPKLVAYVSGLAAQYSKAPVDARIVIEKGQIRVEPDQDGEMVDRAELLDRLDQAFAGFELTPIVVSPTTAKASVKVENTSTAVEEAKKLMAQRVTLRYEDKTFQPTANEIGNWIAFRAGERGGVVPYIDTTRLKDYVQSVAEKVNVAPVNKNIDLVNGVAKVTAEGKEGKAIHQDPAVKAIATSLDSGKGLEFNLTSYDVPFKTVRSQTVNLEGGRYIEISISQQRLWVWEDHKVILESPITSGATSAGFYTPYGLTSIYHKTTNFWMNGYRLGYDYYVYVNYWMPFNGQVGLHDASWRNGVFGGQDYKTNGSHGCVNLPLDTAAYIYNWAGIGTPVWVHA